MTYKIIELTPGHEEAYISYIKEWEAEGNKIVPMAASRGDKTYAQLLESLEYHKSDAVYDQGWVPASLYFLEDDQGILLGAIHFRHELNENLMVEGGHLGYGVRPSQRGHGLGSKMLAMTLELPELKAIDRVLITCDDDNIGSAKTIEKNRGHLENKVAVGDKMVRRYWIERSL